MISFKGILKYSIYLFIAGWMFMLGIMVGRDTSPVKFDTRKFQKRLEAIAKGSGKKEGVQEKIELKFYDVLDSPVPEESTPSKNKHLEIIPRKETIVTDTDTIPSKTSRKRETFQKNASKKKIETDKQKREVKATKASEITKAVTASKTKEGKYTIQIAAYKNFKDAVSQMAALEKKGFSSYREKGQKDGVTWYRIRSGSFVTLDEAKKFKEKLNKVKIKSMIIKKDKS